MSTQAEHVLWKKCRHALSSKQPVDLDPDFLQVWDGISDARITFAASDLSITASHLSRMTENLNLQRGLLRRLSNIPEIQLLDNVRVDVIQKEERQDGNGWPIVRLSNGQTLRTRLLVSFQHHSLVHITNLHMARSALMVSTHRSALTLASVPMVGRMILTLLSQH
jgi:hypothetical protein